MVNCNSQSVERKVITVATVKAEAKQQQMVCYGLDNTKRRILQKQHQQNCSSVIVCRGLYDASRDEKFAYTT